MDAKKRFSFAAVNVILGQLLSMLLTGSGLANQALATEYHFAYPAFQSAICYMLLALIYGCYFAVTMSRCKYLCRKSTVKQEYNENDSHSTNSIPSSIGLICGDSAVKLYIPYYALTALIDFEANFLLILSFSSGITLSHVILLNCLTTPTAMLLERFAFKRVPSSKQLIGIAVCLCGVILLFVWDCIYGHSNEGSSSSIMGYIYAALGSILYGFSNVSQEVLVRRFGVNIFVFMIGCFGCVFAFIQSAALSELSHLGSFHGTTSGLNFVHCLFIYPIVL